MITKNILYNKSIDWIYKIRDVKKKITVIKSPNELENIIKKTQKQFDISDENGQLFLQSWRYDPNISLPKDPFSEEYNNKQLDIYEQLCGKTRHFYREVAQENLDDNNLIKNLYPFSTKNLNIIAYEFASFGYWLKALSSLDSNKKIIEFGAGCGNFALTLAKTGLNVTALDISKRYIDTIKARAKKEKVSISCVVCDMAEFQTTDYYDVAIFCESFHHSDNHIKLMKTLDKILHPTKGVIYFLGEPVTYYKNPWGVRLDGDSIWATRQNGWLELGFDINYFKTLLKKFSWKYQFSRAKSINHSAYVIKATRH